MKIQIVSDIHLESTAKPIKRLEEYLTPSAPYLALLGDIGWIRDPLLKQFLTKVCTMYQKVFYVYGNHEWYNTKHSCVMCQAKEQFREWAKTVPNLVVLDNETYDLDEYRIIGGTMWGKVSWGNIPTVTSMMNDFVHILTRWGKLTVEKTNEFHVEFCDFLERELKRALEDEKPVIVFTHHAPVWDKRVIGEKYWGHPCNEAYMVDMTKYMSIDMQLWAFGHTHHATDFEIGHTRIYSNPKGYDSDLVAEYKKDSVVEVLNLNPEVEKEPS